MRLPPSSSTALLTFLLLLAPASAQTIAPSSTPASARPTEPPVTLSPFEVRPEDDAGYQAMNTTSGSRLATSLRDTAAAISPFTPEFLSDIAATNVTEMLGYAANAELNAGDSEGAGFNNPRDFSSAGGEPFRIRGIPGGVSTDYVENAAPQDLYNIERAEVASGPNSILFGLGAPGGTVALTSKFATLRRNATSAKTVVGSWDYSRTELDHNQVIARNKFGVRLLGLYQDAKGWRKWDLNEQRRITGAFSWQPLAHTAIRGSYQAGNSAELFYYYDITVRGTEGIYSTLL